MKVDDLQVVLVSYKQNKAFVHWSYCLTSRTTNSSSSGLNIPSILVSVQVGQLLVQVVDIDLPSRIVK
jgi:hypothetical protein